MLAYELDIGFLPEPRFQGRSHQPLPDRVKVRQLDRKTWKRDFEAMRDVFNDAWQDNWNFVPFTREEFNTIGKELLMVVPQEYLQIAEIDGEPAAFIALLPDINEAIADLNGRLLPFGWANCCGA